jgi:uncharacterized membrane protein
MHPSNLHFFPLALPFVLGLFLLMGLLIGLIEVGVLKYAYTKIGVDPRYVFLLLLLSLLGSYVNIPVAHLPGEQVVTDRVITYFGMRYVIPMVQEWPGTVIAVNLGGAVIPTLLSLYLLVKHRLYRSGLLGIVIVTAVVHWLATPVPGVGIAVPTFIPPLVATGTAWVLQRRSAPPRDCVGGGAPGLTAPLPLAYIVGSLGTLIGADLLNLGQIQGLGAPVASIGGAGTFDGIFLTGILAVLLA